ncbi:MAG TPA: hypothetical protein VNE42_08585 [Acidimicrobiales bacterium]|nr:hypothetical protein [Acidimicrobiales bacterium]
MEHAESIPAAPDLFKSIEVFGKKRGSLEVGGYVALLVGYDRRLDL